MNRKRLVRNLLSMGLVAMVVCQLVFGGAARAEDTFVRIDAGGKGFLLGGEPWHPFGCNYFDPHVGWAPKLWREFDPARVEKHFRVMKDLGVNVVRVFLTAQSFFADGERLEPAALEKFDRMLEIARRSGIRVHPTGPDHWEGTPSWRRGDLFADETIVARQAAFWKLFSAKYKDEPSIFAYDLLNEPEVRWGGAAMERAWRAWLERRYPALEDLRAAWREEAAGIESLDSAGIPADQPAGAPSGEQPPGERGPHGGSRRLSDFQEFREDLAERWVKAQAEAIRSVDSNHLITVGLIQWSIPLLIGKPSRYAAFRPSRIAGYLDFLSVHFYPLHGDPLSGPEAFDRNLAYLEFVLRYARGLAPSKPLVVGEFGWYGGGAPDGVPERPASGQVEWCRAAVLQGRGLAAGWLNWAYADTPSSRDMSKFSGLVTESDEVKPWGRAFGELARNPGSWLSTSTSPEAREEIDLESAIVDPPAADRAFGRYFESWKKSRGSRLDIKVKAGR